ncbi:MAG: hypothetical protein QNJ98_16040 [Planctomycetota bacterium]|nr:hypothetical protein [Planctomycetota bacterium]
MTPFRTLFLMALFLPLAIACGGGGGGGDAADQNTPVGPEVLLATHAINGSGSGSGSPQSLPTQSAAALGLGATLSSRPITEPLTNADSGRLIQVVAGQGTGLDDWILDLTNGVDDTVFRRLISVPGDIISGGSGSNEGSMGNKHPALTGPDLQGAAITRVEILLTRFRFESQPGSFRYEIEATVLIHGIVPGT